MTGRGGRGAPPLRRMLPWAVLGAAILAVMVTAVGSRRWGRAGGAAPPPLGQVPEFSLLNRDGRAIGVADLAGRPWIAGFIFTRCAGPCPRITAQMARLGTLLPHPAFVQRVSVSVDPAHDTPAVLDAYAAARGIEDPRWFFLTGPRQEVYSLVRDGFKLAVGAEGGAADEPILHSTRLVLVDSGGRIRGYYDAFDEEAVGRLLDDVRALRRQGL